MTSRRGDRQTFKNEDLVLKVTTNIDPAVWDETRYEAFIDELCSVREYQKDAIRSVMHYMADGKHANLNARTGSGHAKYLMPQPFCCVRS